ncbi:general secretion pathway protein GspE [Geomobilimonas luticola]|uniref:General secretion pathway protein GspE n=1 Tax=Geomobilimonas luticola TaxID=1114878 RepID=A0ABS5SEU1_9BACT|nr:general secretion pathway protein GspE [Geomobilimonas luticola]MBT0653883.1 general secretion pathway protein GspE [Geomobilimonas luticola]
MRLKLGEMLVNENIITPDELDETLKCQVIFGGRLGTNLIEMGFISEEQLASFLARKAGVPCTTPQQLNNIPTDILSLLPAELVKKYMAIPIALDKKRLTLAMADPTNLPAIDEISFRTGYIVSPLVAPELRLVFCMENYYGIKRDLRYFPTNRAVGGRRRREHMYDEPLSTGEPAAQPEHLDPFTIDREIIEFPPFEGFDTEPADEPPDEPSTHEQISAAPPVPRQTMESIAERLAEARNRDEIAEALVTYLGQEFQRVALFLIRGEMAVGWRAVHDNRPVANFDHTEVPLDNTSLLRMVVDEKRYYRGAVPHTASNARMLAAMGETPPDIAQIIPLILLGRVVTILYVDGRRADKEARLFDLQKLIGKVAMAFEILILKNKILMS